MSIKSRLTKAEQRAGANEKSFMVAWQELHDPNLFHHGGKTYTAAELDDLAAADHDIIRIVYARDWRSGE